MTPARRKALLAGLIVAALLALGVVVARSPASAQLGRATHAALDACRDAGPLVFFTAMALLPTIGFPLAPFTLAAGPAFSPTLGVTGVIACAVAAIAVNVSLSYWIAARWVRPLALRFVGWLGYRLPDATENSAWLVTLLLRIVPGPPFFVQSYLLGLAHVPFRIYLIVSTLVPLGYVTGIILFGDAIAHGDIRGAIGAVMLMVVIGAAIHLLRTRLTRRAAAADPCGRTP